MNMKFSIRKANESELELEPNKPFRMTRHSRGEKKYVFYDSLEYALYIIKKELDGLVHRGWPDGKMTSCEDCHHPLEVASVDMIKNAFRDQTVYAYWCPKCNDFKGKAWKS